MTSVGGTVVNLSPPHPKIKGLNPAAVADNRREKMGKKSDYIHKFATKSFKLLAIVIYSMSQLKLQLSSSFGSRHLAKLKL